MVFFTRVLSNKRLQPVITRYNRLSRRNKIILGAVLLLILFFIGRAIFSPAKTPQYQTAQVQRDTIISTVSESGNVSAGNQVNVTSPTSGVIEELYVANGDSVTAGENLFKVKATATPDEVASAYASYESAVNAAAQAQQTKQAEQAALEKDRQAVLDAQNNVNYEQNNTTNPSTKQTYTDLEKESIESTLTSARETFTADETKYNEANTAIAAAQAQLNAAALSYQATQDSVVTAPIDGTVANLTADIGSNVSASSGNNSSTTSSGSTSGGGTSSSTTSTSSTTSSSSPVLIIGNFTNLYVKVPASEIDIPNIKQGQKATITLDAFPGKTYVGRVSNVDTIGSNTSGVVTYNVYVSFDYAPTGVQPGMSASVAIQTARHDDVLTVPTTAIQTINGQSYVRVMKNGKVSQVAVTTGIAADTDTEITSGLSEGDTVVTSIVTPATSTSGSSPFSGGGFGGARGFGGGGGGAVLRTRGGGG